MSEERKYTCPECGAEFASRDALRKHIYDEHIEDEDRRRGEDD